jgi:hypothetical protein
MPERNWLYHNNIPEQLIITKRLPSYAPPLPIGNNKSACAKIRQGVP